MLVTGAKSMVLNIDEANRLSQSDMKEVIKLFGMFLIASNKLYFSVTGIYNH